MRQWMMSLYRLNHGQSLLIVVCLKLGEQVGQQLAKVGVLLEEVFGGPQDVEGLFAAGASDADSLYIVQTRPQP